MRRKKRIAIHKEDVGDPERVVYIVPQSVPVEFPVRREEVEVGVEKEPRREERYVPNPKKL